MTHYPYLLLAIRLVLVTRADDQLVLRVAAIRPTDLNPDQHEHANGLNRLVIDNFKRWLSDRIGRTPNLQSANLKVYVTRDAYKVVISPPNGRAQSQQWISPAHMAAMIFREKLQALHTGCAFEERSTNGGAA